MKRKSLMGMDPGCISQGYQAHGQEGWFTPASIMENDNWKTASPGSALEKPFQQLGFHFSFSI
jgi:hypothetical protein